MIKVITAKLIIDEGSLPALQAVRDMIDEVFGREASKEKPRAKLMLAVIEEES